VCDGALPLFRNRTLAVVGGGDSAMEESLYLTKFASEVLVIHRRDQFRASPIMADRVLNHPKIRVLWNSEVSEVLGYDHVTGVRLRDTVSGAEKEIEIGGLFIAIGHTPNRRTCPACSQRVTSWTATTVRRSRLREPGAWQRWKRSAGWRITGSDRVRCWIRRRRHRLEPAARAHASRRGAENGTSRRGAKRHF
jgi:hypothetical protein